MGNSLPIAEIGAPVPTPMKPTVLFVDDSSTIITTVTIAPEDEPFQLVTATDGEQALRKIRGGLRPDVIVTDLNMPGVGGLADPEPYFSGIGVARSTATAVTAFCGEPSIKRSL